MSYIKHLHEIGIFPAISHVVPPHVDALQFNEKSYLYSSSNGRFATEPLAGRIMNIEKEHKTSSKFKTNAKGNVYYYNFPLNCLTKKKRK